MTFRSQPITLAVFGPLVSSFALLLVVAIGCAGCTGSSGAVSAGSPGSAVATGSAEPVISQGSGPTPATPSRGASSGGVGVGAGSSNSSPVGAEGQTPGAVRPCPIASSRQVARSFGARSASFTTRTSALGKPMCLFTMSRAHIGGRPAQATVTMTLDADLGARQFRAVERDVPNVQAVGGLADAAFYANDTGTMQFLKGRTSVVVQATYRVRAGTKYAAKIEANIIALCRRIAADI